MCSKLPPSYRGDHGEQECGDLEQRDEEEGGVARRRHEGQRAGVLLALDHPGKGNKRASEE